MFNQQLLEEFVASLPKQYHYQLTYTTFHKHVPYQVTVYSRNKMAYCFFAGGLTPEETMEEFHRELNKYEATLARQDSNNDVVVSDTFCHKEGQHRSTH